MILLPKIDTFESAKTTRPVTRRKKHVPAISDVGVQVALLGELVEFAQHGGIKPSKLLEVMEALPVMSPAAKAALQSISIGQYEPMFPISLAEKDFRYAVTTATALGTKVPITRHACELFQLAVANGLGELHITAIAMLYQGSG